MKSPTTFIERYILENNISEDKEFTRDELYNIYDAYVMWNPNVRQSQEKLDICINIYTMMDHPDSEDIFRLADINEILNFYILTKK